MSSPGPVDLHVDFAELGRVQRELATLISALVELGSKNMVHADTDAMGSHDVAGAVNRFVEDWETGRHRIVENLQACQDFAAMAVDHYSRTEGTLQGALGPAPSGSASP